jgi:hypothetical protein
MPSLKQHLDSDRNILGAEFPHVHKLLDQFAHYPDMKFLREHRKFLHHREGIEYIRMRFGPHDALSAKQHVLDDCGWVPNMVDYHNGNADNYGRQM